MHVGLEFTMHRDINRVVVHVVQRETGKIVRQIPPEEMLKLAEHLQEASRGLLVNTRS
jgi:flagellar protein FlaG